MIWTVWCSVNYESHSWWICLWPLWASKPWHLGTLGKAQGNEWNAAFGVYTLLGVTFPADLLKNAYLKTLGLDWSKQSCARFEFPDILPCARSETANRYACRARELKTGKSNAQRETWPHWNWQIFSWEHLSWRKSIEWKRTHPVGGWNWLSPVCITCLADLVGHEVRF